MRVTVPAGWSAPSTNSLAFGYSTSSAGVLSISGQRITVAGLTLAGGATLTITYGASSGAPAPSATGTQTWQTLEKSTGAGTLTPIAVQPQVAVT